jgi:hypothetical protein
MITLSLAAGLPLAREAYQNRKLGFQNGKRNCCYRYGDGCCCIIGSMLPDEPAAEFDTLGVHVTASPSLLRLERLNRLAFQNPGERDVLVELQELHDRACSERDADARTYAKEQFISYFNEVLAQHDLEPVT